MANANPTNLISTDYLGDYPSQAFYVDITYANVNDLSKKLDNLILNSWIGNWTLTLAI